MLRWSYFKLRALTNSKIVMIQKLLCFFLFTLSTIQAQVQFGANNYIEFHQGNLPIVISVPHGGSMQPATIPDRTCNSAVTVTDENTI